MGLMIDKPAKTLIERFAKKQPGGHFACPRCGKMTMDAESVTHNALSRRIATSATPAERLKLSKILRISRIHSTCGQSQKNRSCGVC